MCCLLKEVNTEGISLNLLYFGVSTTNSFVDRSNDTVHLF